MLSSVIYIKNYLEIILASRAKALGWRRLRRPAAAHITVDPENLFTS